MPLNLQLLKDGDDREWECAFTELWGVAWTAVNRVIGSTLPQDVEDVAGDALKEMMDKAIHRCRSELDIIPMQMTVARHRAADRHRRFWARLVVHPDQELFDPAAEHE